MVLQRKEIANKIRLGPIVFVVLNNLHSANKNDSSPCTILYNISRRTELLEDVSKALNRFFGTHINLQKTLYINFYICDRWSQFEGGG